MEENEYKALAAARCEARNRVMDRAKTLTPYACVLYSQLDNNAGLSGAAVRTHATLAKQLQITERHVTRLIKRLAAAGLLTFQAGTGRRATRFLLRWRELYDSGLTLASTLNVENSANVRSRTDIPVTAGMTSVSENGHRILSEPVSTEPVKPTTERYSPEIREWTRGAIGEFPGAQLLPGKPDYAIVTKVLDLCGPDPQAELAGALRALHKARKGPERSWAWFPVVLAQYMSHPERRSA